MLVLEKKSRVYVSIEMTISSPSPEARRRSMKVSTGILRFWRAEAAGALCAVAASASDSSTYSAGEKL